TGAPTHLHAFPTRRSSDLAGLLDRHGELVTARLRLAGDVGAVLRVDEDARVPLRRALVDRLLEALPDQTLGAGDLVVVAADHLLERPAVVEREDVQLLVVAELAQANLAHQYSLPVKCASSLRV